MGMKPRRRPKLRVNHRRPARRPKEGEVRAQIAKPLGTPPPGVTIIDGKSES